MANKDQVNILALKRLQEHLEKLAETFERERDVEWDVATHKDWAAALNHTINQVRKLAPIDLPDDLDVPLPEAKESVEKLKDLVGKISLRLG